MRTNQITALPQVSGSLAAEAPRSRG